MEQREAACGIAADNLLTSERAFWRGWAGAWAGAGWPSKCLSGLDSKTSP